eukprot:9502644-Pyramimonas_sp.AAC.2
MEARCTELHDESELLDANPLYELYTVPKHMITDNSALRGHLPKWGYSHDSDIEETNDVPLCSTVEDHSYGLDSDENGQSVELCFAAEISKVVLSERQHRILDADRVTTM